MAAPSAGDSDVNVPAPDVIGSTLPPSFPADFEALAEHFKPDRQWLRLTRGVHYQRTETMMRRHITTYAESRGWAYATQTWKVRGSTRGLYVQFANTAAELSPRGRAPKGRREE